MYIDRCLCVCTYIKKIKCRMCVCTYICVCRLYGHFYKYRSFCMVKAMEETVTKLNTAADLRLRGAANYTSSLLRARCVWLPDDAFGAAMGFRDSGVPEFLRELSFPVHLYASEFPFTSFRPSMGRFSLNLAPPQVHLSLFVCTSTEICECTLA